MASKNAVRCIRVFFDELDSPEVCDVSPENVNANLGDIALIFPAKADKEKIARAIALIMHEVFEG